MSWEHAPPERPSFALAVAGGPAITDAAWVARNLDWLLARKRWTHAVTLLLTDEPGAARCAAEWAAADHRVGVSFFGATGFPAPRRKLRRNADLAAHADALAAFVEGDGTDTDTADLIARCREFGVRVAVLRYVRPARPGDRPQT